MLITGLRTLPSRRPYQGVQLFPSAAATGNEEWGWWVGGVHPGVVGVRWMDMESVNGLSSQRVTVHARATAGRRTLVKKLLKWSTKTSMPTLKKHRKTHWHSAVTQVGMIITVRQRQVSR